MVQHHREVEEGNGAKSCGVLASETSSGEKKNKRNKIRIGIINNKKRKKIFNSEYQRQVIKIS